MKSTGGFAQRDGSPYIPDQLILVFFPRCPKFSHVLLLSPQKHSYNYYDGSNPAHVPDTKSSSLRKKKFSEPKDSEAAAAEEQPKKKPSFSRYPGKQVRATRCRNLKLAGISNCTVSLLFAEEAEAVQQQRHCRPAGQAQSGQGSN